MNFMSDNFTALCDSDDWHTGKNTKKHMPPFTGQIPCGCKPLCQQTLTQPISWDNGEELTRKKPKFKAIENKI